MKIGILTFHHVDNYGAAWQCYSLYTQLKQLGHEPFLVNYRPDDALPVYRMPKGRFWITPRMIGFFKKKASFERFRKAHLAPLSKCLSTFEDLKAHPPSADAFIAGSDQIWNPCLFDGLYDPSYFLEFTDSSKKIAYAASFGETRPIELSEELESMLSKFEHLSVREAAAAQALVNAYGFNVYTVCDPVILSGDFTSFLNAGKFPKDHIFCYNLFNRPQMDEMCAHFSKLYGIKVRRVNDDWRVWRHDSKSEFGIGPVRWLNLINNSRFVVSDSFHSTVFSVLLEKNFVVTLANKHRGKENRIVSLLCNLGLESRIIDDIDTLDDIRSRLESNIDWPAVKRRIQDTRHHSLEFLKTSLAS